MWLTFDMQCYKIDTINQAVDRFLEEGRIYLTQAGKTHNFIL